MITVVCMYWQRRKRPWQTYTARHVNVLRSMFARHLTAPHEFVCATDAADRDQIDDAVRVVPLWESAVRLGNAYPKLEIFAPHAAGKFGERILFCDLDTLLIGSVDHLVDREDDIVLLPEFDAPGRSPERRCHYNTSLVLLRAGCRLDVWERFDPARSPADVKASGKVGSDQTWVSMVLGGGEPIWKQDDGIRSFKYDVMRMPASLGPMVAADEPADASLISFHGRFKPWDSEVQRQCPWVAEHYQ